MLELWSNFSLSSAIISSSSSIFPRILRAEISFSSQLTSKHFIYKVPVEYMMKTCRHFPWIMFVDFHFPDLHLLCSKIKCLPILRKNTGFPQLHDMFTETSCWALIGCHLQSSAMIGQSRSRVLVSRATFTIYLMTGLQQVSETQNLI